MVDVSATCGIAQDDRRSFRPAWGDLTGMGCWIYLLRTMGMRWMSARAMNFTGTWAMVFEDVTIEYGMDGRILQSVSRELDGRRPRRVVGLACGTGPLDLSELILSQRRMRNGRGKLHVKSGAEGWMFRFFACHRARMIWTATGTWICYISGGLEGSMYLENDGNGFYTDVTNDLVVMNEVCWSGQWLDVNADGWEELHITTGIAHYTDFPTVLTENNNEPDALF